MAIDSAVVVVASMLVSPIMGPVLAYTFGVTLKNWNLAMMGVKNEAFSLFMCVVYGAVVGFFWALCTENHHEWPTGEMQARGANLYDIYISVHIYIILHFLYKSDGCWLMVDLLQLPQE